MSSFYKLQIQEVIHETPHAVSIAFSVPNELKPAYQFIAGQYINLKLTLDGKEVRRAYSLCSSPNSGELRIAVKSIKNGVFSSFANDHLKMGDIIEVGQPEGRFTFEPKADKHANYAAFAAGSGITPIMSIIKSVLESEPKSSFVLTYGNKSPEDTIFYNELHDLQLKYVGRFFVHFVFSQTNVENHLFGRIDKSVVNHIIDNKHKEKEFEKFYLCGPEDMINLVAGVLKEHSIPDNRVKFELFSTSIKESKTDTALDGHTKITVLVDDEETTFEMSQKQSLLEAALKHGIDAPYSCRGGICSSCMCRVTKGSVELRKNSILTEDEIEEGLTLACQAYPTSAEIAIDFDDV